MGTTSTTNETVLFPSACTFFSNGYSDEKSAIIGAHPNKHWAAVCISLSIVAIRRTINIQLNPDSSNPRKLEPRVNLNQNRFLLDRTDRNFSISAIAAVADQGVSI